MEAQALNNVKTIKKSIKEKNRNENPLHRLESLKNWGTGEDIGKERTQYELKIAFFKDLQRLRHLKDSSILFQRTPPLNQQIKFAVNCHHLASSSSSLVDYHHKIEETFLEMNLRPSTLTSDVH